MKKIVIYFFVGVSLFLFKDLLANPEVDVTDALRVRQGVADSVTAETYRWTFGHRDEWTDQKDTGTPVGQKDLNRFRFKFMNFLPEVFQHFSDHAQLELEQSDAHARLDYNDLLKTDVWRHYKHYRSELGLEHHLGKVHVKESLSNNRFDNDSTTYPSSDERFIGGSLAVDYQDQLHFCLFDQCRTLGLQATTSYGKDRAFVAGVDTNLHDVDSYKTKVEVIGSRWLLESIYENKFLDNKDDYYSTRNTVALYFAPSGKPGAAGTWMVVTGIQHMRTNLNPRELLGVLLEARQFEGTLEDELNQKYGQKNRQFVIGLMVDPFDQNWAGSGADQGWQFYVSEEQDVYGMKIYAESADGDWGNTNAGGWDFFMRF